MEPRTIFFIGKPGCGKGTQARLLAKRTGWRIIGSGEQFREISKEDTHIGRKTKDTIDNGELMPPWFAMYLYLKGLFSINPEESVIFDGFNRKPAEAQLIIDSLKWLNRSFLVVEIAIPDEEVRVRLEGRREKEGRADDNAIETRIEEYDTYTAHALDLFKKMGDLVSINGERPIEEVAADIEKAVCC